MSSAKKPLVSSPRSPRSSQMQNVVPSRIVSVTGGRLHGVMIRHDAWPRTPSGTCCERRSTTGPSDTTTRGPSRPPRSSTISSSWPGSKPERACSRSAAARARRRCPLAERGFSIVAVELGANLAELARRKLAAFPHVEIVTSSFEEWDPAGERFDAVVSFNAFHWLDPDVRFAKSASVLRRADRSACSAPRFVVHDDADAMWLERLRGRGEPQLGFEPRHSTTCAIARPTSRRRVLQHGHPKDLPLGSHVHADEYVALLATMSTYRALPDDVASRAVRAHQATDRGAGGTVSPTRADVLYVATTA